MTSSLLKLRAWLTLKEAAAYLSSKTGDDVDEVGILRLALDGKLQASVKLPQPMEAIQVCEGTELAGRRKGIEGVWDLSLKGPGRLELEHRDRVTCGLLPYVELGTDEGAFVTGEEGVVYQLLPSRERPFAPKDNSVFPAGSQLGVRPQALDAVVARLALPSLDPEEQSPSKADDVTDPLDKPLEVQRERATLLTIIAALADEADIDISKASKAGVIIEARTVELGARVAARTIEGHLKRISDALDRRRKISN